jgi:signal transduction histidine kinase
VLVMTIPTNQDFAGEVRSERLTILWQVTLTISMILVWVLISLGLIQDSDSLLFWAGALAPVAVGSLLTYLLLRLKAFIGAVWGYALGGLAAIVISLFSSDVDARQIAPFALPVLIFIVGLLMPVSSTFLLTALGVGLTLFVPRFIEGSWEFLGWYQWAAVALSLLSTLLAAQVTGELYRVTEWALKNYQRERQTAQELFESQQLLELALKRSQSLSERLQEINDELEEARHVAEEARDFRGKFLANMSHELRTPLNAIIGFSETMLKFPMMYDNVELPAAYQEDLEQIYRSGRHLLGIINDILDLSKVDAGKLELQMGRLDLKPVLTQALATAAGLVGDRPIKLNTDLPDVLPPVTADEARLQQVLLNLYSNAAKFTEKGSITLIVREDGDFVRISLRDTGSGIPPQHLEDIFEEFKQAGSSNRRDPRSGAGLGLAISRQLMTLMGGQIWAESAPPDGSTFHLQLRRYRVDEEAAVAQAQGA